MKRKVGPQWVRSASPQLAPTAPATTVFIALSSVRQIMFSESACPNVQWLGSGKIPASLLHCTRSAVACRAVGVQTFGQAHILFLVHRRDGPYLYWVYMLVRGHQGGGGLAQGLGIRLFAVGGAYWPLATAHHQREGRGGGFKWSGCIVHSGLWLRLPHSCHRLLFIVSASGASLGVT